MRIDQPVIAADPGPIEKGVHHAFALQNPFPDQRHDHRRQQDRKEEDRAEEAARPDFAVEDDRGQQREADHEAHLQRHEPRGVPDCAPELVLAAGVGVEIAGTIHQRDEVARAHVRPVGQHHVVAARGGVEEIEDHRQEGEEAKENEVGQQEDPGQAVDAKQPLQGQHGDLDQPHERRDDAEHGRVLCRKDAPRTHWRGGRWSDQLASAIAASRSSSARSMASATVSSPTMAWLRRSTVMPNMARLPA